MTEALPVRGAEDAAGQRPGLHFPLKGRTVFPGDGAVICRHMGKTAEQHPLPGNRPP